MEKILFAKDYSDHIIQDEDITELLALTASEPSICVKDQQEVIKINRSVLKGMFLAEELGGSVTLENTDDGLCFYLRKNF